MSKEGLQTRKRKPDSLLTLVDVGFVASASATNKVVTAATVLRLQEQGLLSLDRSLTSQVRADVEAPLVRSALQHAILSFDAQLWTRDMQPCVIRGRMSVAG